MPKLTVTPDWKTILRHAWSVRLMILAALLSGLEVALPLVNGLLPIRPGIFALLSGLVVAGAFVARFVVQKKIRTIDIGDRQTASSTYDPEWEDGE